MGCCHDCGNCSGCGRELTITAGEIALLQLLAQTPFLPVGWMERGGEPVCLGEAPQEARGNLLLCLEKKGLVSLSDDRPLRGCPVSDYGSYPIRGSLALTARGQAVLELLDLQGALPE